MPIIDLTHEEMTHLNTALKSYQFAALYRNSEPSDSLSDHQKALLRVREKLSAAKHHKEPDQLRKEEKS